MRIRSNHRKGLTLVEVIVVLVVLAILAAIMIPSMSGWIDKAKEKRLVAACRDCVDAAQGYAVLNRSRGKTTYPSSAEVISLAGVKSGSISGLEYQTQPSSTVKYLTYNDGKGGVVTYFADEAVDKTYQFLSRTLDMSDQTIRDEIRRIMAATGKSKLDNGAMNDPKLSSGGAYEALKALGIDLTSNMDAASWQFVASGPFFYWSTVDVSTLEPGAKVPVMRYNYSTGTFTVWEATVRPTTPQGGSTTYNIFNSYGKLLSSSDKATDQTYARMLEDYKNVLGNYS